MKHYLEHTGLVTDSRDGRVVVSLTGSGCSACHKSLCMLGESKAKEVEFTNLDNQFLAGEEVVVRINPGSGHTAVALLYLVPFILMVITLLSLTALQYPEGLAGLASLVILIPYFLILYTFRNMLSRHCHIELMKR